MFYDVGIFLVQGSEVMFLKNDTFTNGAHFSLSVVLKLI